MTSPFADAVDRLRPPEPEVLAAARARWDTRIKPQGSLGRLEELGTQLAGIAGTCPPPSIERPSIVVFAGDHGVVARGVSNWPSEITGLMAATVADGEAAINAFARQIGASTRVVDVGMLEPHGHPGVDAERVGAGTADLSVEPAMTLEQARSALDVGATAAAADEGDCLIGGELGIGNTAAAAAVIGTFAPPNDAPLAGLGAGLDPAALPEKERIVRDAAARARALDDPLARLAEVGGFEIAALAGFYVGGVASRRPVVVDGVIGCAALLAAEALAPGTAGGCIAGHRSAEPAATTALEHLGLEPVIDLGLRLGEGTGAALAVPLLRAAIAALTEMAELPAPS